ncbi:putative short chain type dehydrogenase [Pyrenochaeta sp. DS3sAY3a]|nr:putative short chain type dehydrogenase [Pyrenochaeta sp. DS3sAY3a]
MGSFATYPDLNGKVALIAGIGQTGGPEIKSWGNGAAIARGLAANGVKVFGCDMNLDAAKQTATRIKSEGGVCDVMRADVTKDSSIREVVDTIMKKHGRVDILVNNVGMPASGHAGSLDEAVWDKQMDLNLKSVYLMCRLVLPIMEAQGQGAIVNNASIAGLRYLGKPQVAYSTAKAGVLQFTKVTAVEYANKGVRLNCVVPGLMLTPLVESLGRSESEVDRQMYRRITEHNVPSGTMGDAHDVANATLFLSSNAAKYITGQKLVVDGALTSSTGTGYNYKL